VNSKEEAPVDVTVVTSERNAIASIPHENSTSNADNANMVAGNLSSTLSISDDAIDLLFHLLCGRIYGL